MILKSTLKPISTPAFRQSLLSTCGARGFPSGQTIGLAISGGVDSMALAILSKLLHNENPQAFNFKCFVVDHKARSNSSIEAEQVEKNLRRLGLSVETLALKWDDSGPPLLRNNFETEARTLRFQSLGQACLRSRVRSLLLAHHEDDQAETILVRILGGYTGRGFKGIKPCAAFPECHGIYGVHEGSIPESRLKQHQAAVISDGKISSAGPGLSIHRPLLHFGKSSLIATCKHYGVPWIEDSTNEDSAVTPRNAVRALLARDQLPEALSTKSLLALNTKAVNIENRQTHQAYVLFEACKAGIKFDPTSGRLNFTIPSHVQAAIIRDQGLHGDVLPDFKVFIKQLTEVVTPQPSVSLDQVKKICNYVSNAMSSNRLGRVLPFTGAGTYWQPSNRSSSSRGCGWTVSRQPLARTLVSRASYNWTTGPSDRVWSQGNWHLFDGRFWIRASSLDGTQLSVRSLTPVDLSLLRSYLSAKQRTLLENKLVASAPGGIRYTLPLLISEDSCAMALPSLDIDIDKRHCGLQYSIRYKNLKFQY